MVMSFLEKRKSLERMIAGVKSPSRHAIRNAWRCIDLARTLQPIDPEMSCFRAITADEEAATALIKLVKERNYVNSKQLKAKLHNQKNIVFLVIKLASDHFKTASDKTGTKVFLDGFNKEKLQLKIIFPWLPDGIASEPIPPLNFSVEQDNQPYTFQDELKSLIDSTEIEKISSFIDEQANLRNKILYANEKGMPSINDDLSPFIEDREKRVYMMTFVYLLIAQHREKQKLVQQCVDATVEVAIKVRNKD